MRITGLRIGKSQAEGDFYPLVSDIYLEVDAVHMHDGKRAVHSDMGSERNVIHRMRQGNTTNEKKNLARNCDSEF